MFKIVIPHIEVNGIFRRCAFSRKLARRELHGIHMLALFVEQLRIRVREQKDAVVEHDLASLASRVPGQPGMADRIDIASPHALAHLKQRRYRRVSKEARAAIDE